jgi:glycosyltransferase involved in cell wall biosynthesis
MNNYKPKILIVADTYYPKVDGTLKFIEEVIKRTKNNFDISLLVPEFSCKQIKGIQTDFLEVSKHFHISGYHTLKFSFKNLKAIKKVVLETDLVFVQGPALVSYLAVHYAHKYKKKTALYIHVVSWDLFAKFFHFLINKIIKRIFVRSYNKCSQIIIPYFGLVKELREAGVKSDIQVARLGVDINRFLPAKNKQARKKKFKLPDKTIVGYVGRISKEKNTLVLLKALKKLDPEKFFLLMVGDGKKEIVEEFKKVKNCKITGFVDNVEDYLQAMDIFVMPSLVETTSLATLEAMSCGLPVIVTKVGYMKDYVIKDYNGLFFPRANPTLLALKIDKLRKDYELREKLSSNARKTTAYSFSWERSINKIKKIILKLHHQF